jgi:CMP-N,N'-diacetyllegionaminic acid synthase
MNVDNTLFVIPARGDSKGIPGKNIKLLGGKPLICYSIDVARAFTNDENICVTSDSDDIIAVVNAYGLQVPFKRPSALATDTIGTYEVLLHALNHYTFMGNAYDKIVLLQPTSPFRTEKQVEEAIHMFTSDIDMVVSVNESKCNPYYNLFEESNGFLTKSKAGNYIRRQDCPPVYAYSGAIYVININSLLKGPLSSFKKVKKYVTDQISSHDLDDAFDWLIAEAIINKTNF